MLIHNSECRFSCIIIAWYILVSARLVAWPSWGWNHSEDEWILSSVCFFPLPSFLLHRPSPSTTWPSTRKTRCGKLIRHPPSLCHWAMTAAQQHDFLRSAKPACPHALYGEGLTWGINWFGLFVLFCSMVLLYVMMLWKCIGMDHFYPAILTNTMTEWTLTQ